MRARAREEGLWAPHLPPEAGGTGQGFLAYAYLNEEIGRTVWAQYVFGCQAPDAGNGEILHMFGTEEQKRGWLEPLVAGDVRSFFSMTEPEVPGSDPTTLRTRAVRDGDEWVIDGHKWFSSGAEGAAFAIVMAVTDPDAQPHQRATQIIVPADAPGITITPVPVFGHRGRGWSTHCEVTYEGVRVPVANTLGEPGDGFRIAQKRLGPGRIHHVMRWLGQMQRAFELLCTRALEREAFGSRLADKQTVQNWIADSAADIHACRLMTLDAAHKIDAGDEARVEISIIKFVAARVLNEVIDRAIQVHGGLGLTDRTPLGVMYVMARGARIYDGPDEVHRMVVEPADPQGVRERRHVAVQVATSRAVTLAARPTGFPSEQDFALVEQPVPEPGPGEVLVRILWTSVDPYQRARMSTARSYAKHVEIGEVMTAQSLGEVVESQDGRFEEGDLVVGQLGWQDYAVARGGTRAQGAAVPRPADARAARRRRDRPDRVLRAARRRPAEARATRSSSPARPARSAASSARSRRSPAAARSASRAAPDKRDDLLNEYGFDEAIDYKGEDLRARLKECVPRRRRRVLRQLRRRHLGGGARRGSRSTRASSSAARSRSTTRNGPSRASTRAR